MKTSELDIIRKDGFEYCKNWKKLGLVPCDPTKAPHYRRVIVTDPHSNFRGFVFDVEGRDVNGATLHICSKKLGGKLQFDYPIESLSSIDKLVPKVNRIPKPKKTHYRIFFEQVNAMSIDAHAFNEIDAVEIASRLWTKSVEPILVRGGIEVVK